MTTVANKDIYIGADKRRTNFLPCGSKEFDDSVTKVFKYKNFEWGQAGMVGLTNLMGLHLQGHDVREHIQTMCSYCRSCGRSDDQIVGQLLVYNGSNKILLQCAAEKVDKGTLIEFGEIGIDFFSIGTGSEFAFPILMKGGSIHEAITHAMNNDEGTGGGIDMAHEQIDSSKVVIIQQSNNVQDALCRDGFVDMNGTFTDKSLAYTSTKILNLQELAKMGLVKNVTQL